MRATVIIFLFASSFVQASPTEHVAEEFQKVTDNASGDSDRDQYEDTNRPSKLKESLPFVAAPHSSEDSEIDSAASSKSKESLPFVTAPHSSEDSEIDSAVSSLPKPSLLSRSLSSIASSRLLSTLNPLPSIAPLLSPNALAICKGVANVVLSVEFRKAVRSLSYDLIFLYATLMAHHPHIIDAVKNPSAYNPKTYIANQIKTFPISTDVIDVSRWSFYNGAALFSIVDKVKCVATSVASIQPAIVTDVMITATVLKSLRQLIKMAALLYKAGAATERFQDIGEDVNVLREQLARGEIPRADLLQNDNLKALETFAGIASGSQTISPLSAAKGLLSSQTPSDNPRNLEASSSVSELLRMNLNANTSKNAAQNTKKSDEEPDLKSLNDTIDSIKNELRKSMKKNQIRNNIVSSLNTVQKYINKDKTD